MTPPTVTVVIPTFNRAGALGACLDSVLGQTQPPLEVVVVDDGSDDETEAVVRRYPEDVVRYHRLARRSGAQAARNEGVRIARGDWIAFQDSDDEWLPDKLERQIELLATVGFDSHAFVHGQALRMAPDGVATPLVRPRITGEAPLEILLRRPSTLMSAFLVSRLALDEIGGLDEQAPSYHEWETAIRLGRVCRFLEPDEPVFVYHLGRPDSISVSRLKDVQGYQYVVEKFQAEIVEQCGHEGWDAHIRHQARRSLEFELWGEARRLIGRLRRRDPRFYAYSLCLLLRLRPSRVLGTQSLRARLLGPGRGET